MEHKGEKHHFKDTVIAPTCTASGYTLRTCTLCGYSYQTRYLPAEHKYQVIKDDYVVPTCTTEGFQKLKCKECNTEKNMVIPPLGHSWGSWETDLVPTCLAEGVEIRKCICRGCSALERRPIPAMGHKLTRPRDSQTQKGATEYFCGNCGDTVIVESTFRRKAGWIVGGISAAVLAAILLLIIL